MAHTNPTRAQVDEVLADMARHLRMDAHEGAALGAGFHAASVMSQDELKRERARAMLHEAHRLNRIVEAAETSWHEDDDYRKYDTPEPAPVIEIRNPAKFVQAVLVYLALGTALVAWMLHVRGCL